MSSTSTNPFDLLGSSSEEEEEEDIVQRVIRRSYVAPPPPPEKVLTVPDLFEYDGNAMTMTVVKPIPQLAEYSTESVKNVFSRFSKKARKVYKSNNLLFITLLLHVLGVFLEQQEDFDWETDWETETEEDRETEKKLEKRMEIVYTIFRRQFLNLRPTKEERILEGFQECVRIMDLRGMDFPALVRIVGVDAENLAEIAGKFGCGVLFVPNENVTTCPELVIFALNKNEPSTSTSTSDMVGAYNRIQDYVAETVSKYETETNRRLPFTMEAVKPPRFTYQKGSKHYKQKRGKH